MNTPTRNTIDHLRACQAARAAGRLVAFTTDPTWLVDVAINRRAGWPDDPSLNRGSARPTNDGRFPPKADGDTHRGLRRLADKLNGRFLVREHDLAELGRIGRRIAARVSPGRLTTLENE